MFILTKHDIFTKKPMHLPSPKLSVEYRNFVSHSSFGTTISRIAKRAQQHRYVVVTGRILHIEHDLNERIHCFYSPQCKIFVDVKVNLVTPGCEINFHVIHQVYASTVWTCVAAKSETASLFSS